ncbi:MAG: hypothetical protein HY905_25480 [Deltaproteobacteria bacterium]|nr:hypothetical protein [Deltaproteobacteria bacterium]
MAMEPNRLRDAALLLPLLLAACRCGGGDSGTDAEAETGCTFAACDQECRAAGRCYGSCTGGRCGCSTSCGDGDADADTVWPDEGSSDADPEGDDGDGADGEVTIETRDGASPGVGCRKVPKPLGRTVPPAAGQGSWVLHAGSDSEDPWRPTVLTLFDWATLGALVLDDVSDLESAGTKFASDASIDGMLTAYVRAWFTWIEGGTSRLAHDELRLLDLATGGVRSLATNQGVPSETTMDFVTLDYPWVVWRDSSEEWGMVIAYALNIDTGEKVDLVPREGGVIGVGLLDGIALLDQTKFTLVDLETGGRRVVADYLCVDMPEAQCDGRWGAVITPNWIAWMDSRAAPECHWFIPCGTQIWGWDRRTETEHPLVVSPGMHGPMLAGRGDWLAWEDQRDDPDPYREADRQQNMYALYLPTMTELQIEDWPGFQFWPSIYANGDEYHVLFYEEVGPMGVTDDLWDCTLPDVAGGS